MNVHDWSKVGDDFFHDFHNRWITHLTESLNDGLLPGDYYARSEQYFGRKVADVITLRPPPTNFGGDNGTFHSQPSGAVAVADVPPKVRLVRWIEPTLKTRKRSVAIRHATGDDLIALVEVVSNGNKDREESVQTFTSKVGDTLRARVHVLLLDLLPPTDSARNGIHVAVTEEFRSPWDEEDAQPADRPVALLSYKSMMPGLQAFIEFLAVGDPLPDMPLFLNQDYYVNLPLGPTYERTYRGLSRIDRNRLTAAG